MKQIINERNFSGYKTDERELGKIDVWLRENNFRIDKFFRQNPYGSEPLMPGPMLPYRQWNVFDKLDNNRGCGSYRSNYFKEAEHVFCIASGSRLEEEFPSLESFILEKNNV